MTDHTTEKGRIEAEALRAAARDWQVAWYWPFGVVTWLRRRAYRIERQAGRVTDEGDRFVPVSLIEGCLRLRSADGTHKVPAEARNIIRAAMDGYLSQAIPPGKPSSDG